ncbi:MAG: LLM class flavin-dependent oxidoreductase [SAR202 cluster bacterium]|nr:LLM class flavin-dependent oxidoreductase [SAR202 cluster bacterium]MQG77883.1 LLM class flavin-dependent oxidoreductase [SAR202 cluster bacterium]
MGPMNNMGVLLPTRGVLVYAKGGRPRVELNWQMAETAERIGYDSVWVGDSITSKPRLEPMAVMAALAARTHRVKIGTAVMLNALRHPVHLAHSIATIDNISDGRIILGLGAGRSNNQMFVDEHAAVGVPIEERAARMEESIDVLRKLWTEDDVSNPDGFYPLSGMTLEPRPVQQPVPIWLSSNWVQRGLKRVAAQGDGWITNVPSTEMFTKCWDRIEEKGQELSRDVSRIPRALYISVNLNDEDEALAEGDGFMRSYYGIPYEVVSKQLLCVFGPAQKAIDVIKRYKEAGANYFIVRFASPNQMQQLEKFTELVVPSLK